MSIVKKKDVVAKVETIYGAGEAKSAKKVPHWLMDHLAEQYADADISAYGGNGPSTESLTEAVAMHIVETGMGEI